MINNLSGFKKLKNVWNTQFPLRELNLFASELLLQNKKLRFFIEVNFIVAVLFPNYTPAIICFTCVAAVRGIIVWSSWEETVLWSAQTCSKIDQCSILYFSWWLQHFYIYLVIFTTKPSFPLFSRNILWKKSVNKIYITKIWHN